VAPEPIDRLLPMNERDFRFLVENTEDVISVVARDGTVVYVNRRGAERLGIPPESLIGRTLPSLLAPEEVARVMELRSARHAGRSTTSRYETTLMLPDLGRIDVEVTATGTEWNGQPADVVILRDISERRKAEAQLRHREGILRSIAAAAEKLVHYDSWTEGIDETLESIGLAAGVDRAWLWEAVEEPDGEIRISGQRGWASEECQHKFVGFSYVGLRLRASGFDRHIDLFLRSGILSEPLDSYPEPARSQWEAAGIRAVLAAPILVDGRLWGVLGFSDCTRKREWSAIEIDALRILTSTVGALIRQERIRDELRVSEERLRLTVEQAPAGIFMADEQGRYTEVNSSACLMLGYTREELLKLTIPEIVPLEMREAAMSCFDRIRKGEPEIIETALIRKSGENLPVEVNAKRLSDGRIQAIVTDITERKQAQDELRRRDAILEVVSTAAERFLDSTVWEEQIGRVLEQLGRITGADRAFLYENQVAQDGAIVTVRRYGWLNPDSRGIVHPQALDGMPIGNLGLTGAMGELRAGRILQLRREDSPPELSEVLERVGIGALVIVPILVGDELWGYFGMAEHSTPRIWLHVELEALRTAGNIIGALVRKRRVEAALRASEQRYRTLVEGTKQSIVLIDRYGVFRFGNSTAATRLGFTQEGLVGKTMWEIFPRGIADGQMELLRQAIENREPLVVERPTIVQGEEKWHETRIHPLVDENRRCDSALVLISDIGERKRAEAEILSYQRRLRSLSSELILTEERERRRIAAQLHDRIGQSLTLAKMRLGAARQASLSDGARSKLDEVRELLDATIHDARSLMFELSPPVLYELGFEPAVEWLAERFQERHGIPTSFEDDRAPKPLAADLRVFLFQAVQELLLNVAKHAQAKSVHLSVRRDGDQIVVGVEDDGIGCDPSRVAAVGAPDAGFGLFNIRERLGLLGGRLEVESAAGAGTRAWLRALLLPEIPQDGGK
jgi:PAS domain S-box-containing protein